MQFDLNEQSIMQTAKAKEYRSLRGRAIECLSLIGCYMLLYFFTK